MLLRWMLAMSRAGRFFLKTYPRDRRDLCRAGLS